MWFEGAAVVAAAALALFYPQILCGQAARV
jgi:hypothetical protein